MESTGGSLTHGWLGMQIPTSVGGTLSPHRRWTTSGSCCPPSVLASERLLRAWLIAAVSVNRCMRLRFSAPPAALVATKVEYRGQRWHLAQPAADAATAGRALEVELHAERVEPIVEHFKVCAAARG